MTTIMALRQICDGLIGRKSSIEHSNNMPMFMPRIVKDEAIRRAVVFFELMEE